MAIDYSLIPALMTGLDDFPLNALSGTQLNILQRTMRFLTDVLQDGAKVVGDGVAKTGLDNNTEFVTNNDASDRVITMNGTAYTFTAGRTYCCDPGEATFFISRASDLGFNFIIGSLADFDGANGVRGEFVW